MTRTAGPAAKASDGAPCSGRGPDILKDLEQAREVSIGSGVVVVGLGNVLLKDEGVGVHVAHALRKARPTGGDGFDVIDGGTSPEVFHLVERARKLVLVDAASGGGEPGSVYRFHPEDIIPEGKSDFSVHQIDLMASLRMMELSRSRPDEVVIIGIEPKEIGWGLELSPELSDKLPEIIKVVMDEVKSK